MVAPSLLGPGGEDIGVPARGLFLAAGAGAGYAVLCGAISVALARAGAEAGPAPSDPLHRRLLKSQQFWFRLLFVVLAAAVGGYYIEDTCGGDGSCHNWHLMYWYSLLLIVTANLSLRPHEFYLGEGATLPDTLKFYLLGRPLPPAAEVERRVRAKYGAAAQRGGGGDEAGAGLGFWTLMPSVFITWICAKSVRQSALFGARFGMLGGVACDSWYLSFFSSGVVCYFLRTRYGFKSLPSAIHKNYGALGALCFMLCVLFRLFNEVWSNATIVGALFGPLGSDRYWGACWFSVLVPAVYVVLGGMRASLFSDVLQAALAVVGLVVVLGSIAADGDFSASSDAFAYAPQALHGASGWEPGWWAYGLAGAVSGIISYPWFDPVLTDRAFLAQPGTMLRSFCIGGLAAMLFAFFYAIVGVYGAWLKEKYAAECGCGGGARGAACPGDWDPCSHLAGELGEAGDVAWLLGRRTYRGAEVFLNLVMITASLSTLDSTFSSCSKLVSLEFCGWLRLKGDDRGVRAPLRPADITHIGDSHMYVARACIVAIAVVGTAFLGYEKDAMRAATTAGMSVMGLGAPVWWMAVWRTKTEGRRGWRRAPLALLAPVALGCYVGIAYYVQERQNEERVLWCAARQLGGDCVTKEQGWTYKLDVGSGGAYGRYLGTTLAGHGAVILVFFVFFALHQLVPLTPEVAAKDEVEEALAKAEAVEDIEKTDKVVTVLKV